MLKLRFSKPSFKSYMDGKINVCLYNCTILDVNTKEVIDEFTVSGTAKLAEGDTMSDLGIKLADSRAKLAAYRRAARIIPTDCDADREEKEKFDEQLCIINQVLDLCDFSAFMHHMKRKEIEHINILKKG